jgi:hypothetical protein
MRDDHSAAATTLRRIATSIASADSGDYVRLRAYLVRVGRLCRDHELVRAALLELRRRESHDDERFAQREQATLAPISAAFHRVAAALNVDGPVIETTLRSLEPTLQETGRAQPRQTLGKMLHEARAKRLQPLALDDLTLLERATEHLRLQLNGHVERDPEVAPIITDLNTIRSATAAAAKLIETRTMLDHLSFGRTIDRLIQHADAWEAALKTDAIVGPPGWQDGLAQSALVLIDGVCDELDFHTVRRFALYRLRVFFETFEYERLRTDLASPTATRRREAILQREMERFLFQEGYYPITNLAASRGNIDTALVEGVERAGVPPILVELKQVTDVHDGSPRATAGAVRAEIQTARGEIQRYRGFLASRPQWAGIVPFVVVIHTCVDDLSDLERDDVILIDLSNVTPSGKRGRRLHPVDES